MHVIHQQRPRSTRRKRGRERVQAVHHGASLLGVAGLARRSPQHPRTDRPSALHRVRAPRDSGLEQIADHPIGNTLLELVAPRTAGNRADARRRGRRILEQPRLADAGRPLDEHDRTVPARRPRQRSAQLRALGLALKQAHSEPVASHYETLPASAPASPALARSTHLPLTHALGLLRQRSARGRGTDDAPHGNDNRDEPVRQRLQPGGHTIRRTSPRASVPVRQ